MKARRLAALAILGEGAKLTDAELDLAAFGALNALRADPKGLKKLLAETLDRASFHHRVDVQEEILRMFGTFE